MKVATLSLAILAGACGTRKEQTTGLSEDLKKDLAMASAPASDLATAPNSYQRMRFVSAVEQARASTPAKRPVATKRHTAPVRRPEAVAKPANDVVDEPAVAVSETPATTPAPEAVTTAMPEPVVITQQPAAEPAPVPVATGRTGSGEDGELGERGRGRGVGGLGGILGGIIGAVVIRGGHGGVDKCDPRTDGRRRPPMMDRPVFGLPLPTGQTFPSRGGR